MKEKITMDSVFSERNLDRALQIVVKRNAMPGMDGLRASDLPRYWKEHKRTILADIDKGRYTPIPCMLIRKNKPGKKEKREILVGSALDQMLQHCIRFEVDRYFTPTFHSNSYGFMRGRNTDQAIRKCLEYMNGGRNNVVDADIKKCFDSIKHRIVLEELGNAVVDTRIMDLINKYLKNPGIIGKQIYHHRVGVPQGSCLSPLLANIVLNRLDWYLDKMHIHFVRYADDLILFLTSDDEAKRAKSLLENYLVNHLSLALNEEKTHIVDGEEAKFLGYNFKRYNEKYVLDISDKVMDKMFMKMIYQVNRRYSNAQELLDRVGAFNRGWLEYYGKIGTERMMCFINETETEELDRIMKVLHENGNDSRTIMRSILESKGYVMLSERYNELQRKGCCI